jgi:hypothetical protein
MADFTPLTDRNCAWLGGPDATNVSRADWRSLVLSSRALGMRHCQARSRSIARQLTELPQCQVLSRWMSDRWRYTRLLEYLDIQNELMAIFCKYIEIRIIKVDFRSYI